MLQEIIADAYRKTLISSVAAAIDKYRKGERVEPLDGGLEDMEMDDGVDDDSLARIEGLSDMDEG